MFRNKKIKERQLWNDEFVNFQPDSSPEAWEHYKKYYLQTLKEYDFNKLYYYNNYDQVEKKHGYNENGKWYNYVNSPSLVKDNRLYALHNNTTIIQTEDVEYCEATLRYGGDCDFNFNDKKYKLFMKIICGDLDASEQEKENAKEKLNKCKKNHHRLLNFSLMQAIGNMQGVKGENRFDRIDTFVYELNRYFSKTSNKILSASTKQNVNLLIEYLNGFKDIYEYCCKIYFIQCHLDKVFYDENSISYAVIH